MATTLYGWLIVLAPARPQQANDIKKGLPIPRKSLICFAGGPSVT